MTVFKSKVDSWLLAVLLGSAAMSLFAAIAISQQTPATNKAIAAGIIFMGVGLPAWLFLSTKYVIAEGILRIVSGPFSWRVEIKSITEVSETRNPISSPALSLDRLEIHYGNRKTILVSPLDKQAFRNAIGHPE